MTITRCPACLTVFRVGPEQLTLRNGRVRCGHCYRPFDALAHALPEDAAPSATQPPPRTELPLEKLTDPFAALDFEIPAAPTSVRATPKVQPAEPPAAAFEAPPAPVAALREPAFDPRADSGQVRWKPASEPEAGPLAHLGRGSRGGGIERIEPSLEASDDGLPPPAPASVEARARAIEDDVDDWRARIYDKEAPATPNRWLWALGVGMLLGTFAAQASYLYRESITREWPQLRPLYLELCARLSCEVPLSRIAEHVVIERSDLLFPERGSRQYELQALVANKATFPQQVPHLELTLTDKDGQALARRALTPAEWLAEGTDPEAGMAAGARVELRLPLSTPDLRGVTGYRIATFYP